MNTPTRAEAPYLPEVPPPVARTAPRTVEAPAALPAHVAPWWKVFLVAFAALAVLVAAWIAYDLTRERVVCPPTQTHVGTCECTDYSGWPEDVTRSDDPRCQ